MPSLTGFTTRRLFATVEEIVLSKEVLSSVSDDLQGTYHVFSAKGKAIDTLFLTVKSTFQGTDDGDTPIDLFKSARHAMLPYLGFLIGSCWLLLETDDPTWGKILPAIAAPLEQISQTAKIIKTTLDHFGNLS